MPLRLAKLPGLPARSFESEGFCDAMMKEGNAKLIRDERTAKLQLRTELELGFLRQCLLS